MKKDKEELSFGERMDRFAMAFGQGMTGQPFYTSYLQRQTAKDELDARKIEREAENELRRLQAKQLQQEIAANEAATTTAATTRAKELVGGVARPEKFNKAFRDWISTPEGVAYVAQYGEDGAKNFFYGQINQDVLSRMPRTVTGPDIRPLDYGGNVAGMAIGGAGALGAYLARKQIASGLGSLGEKVMRKIQGGPKLAPDVMRAQSPEVLSRATVPAPRGPAVGARGVAGNIGRSALKIGRSALKLGGMAGLGGVLSDMIFPQSVGAADVNQVSPEEWAAIEAYNNSPAGSFQRFRSEMGR